MKNRRQSEHFTTKESACRCGECEGYDEWTRQHLQNLESLRAKVCIVMGKDWPVICSTALGLNGGNRCPTWNPKCGGAASSRHMQRDASDIYVPGMSAKELAQLCEQVGPVDGTPGTVDGFGGIGVGNNYVHVDSRPRKSSGARSRWTYTGVKYDWMK